MLQEVEVRELPVSTKLIPGEDSKRKVLLPKVIIDKRGVAHCKDSESSIETLLSAIVMDSGKRASLVPFERSPNHTLQFPIETGTPSRFGFIAGHDAGIQISLVLRNGLYRARPLVVGRRFREAYIALEGIKDDEVDEQRWANEVQAFTELGFNPGRSRVVCNKISKTSQGLWETKPLVASSETKFDFRFQILFYATRDIMESYIVYDILRGESYSGVRTRFNGLHVQFLTGAFEVVLTSPKPKC